VGSKGKVVLQATRGTFRFVTGTQDHSVYQINNPYGSLGVRGTAFTCEVKSPEDKKKQIQGCDIKCKVESGSVVARTNTGNQQTFTAGETFCQENGSFRKLAGAAPTSPPLGGTAPCTDQTEIINGSPVTVCK
jgi:hypothetical protein